MAPARATALRRELPGIRLVQVIHVTGPEAIDEALEVAPFVDALLLDSGNPRAAVKELGGTGRVHDWSISVEIRRRAGKPLFLAGGLTPENVAAAVAAVQPFGVDVCSGVRTEGKLDREKLRRFFAALKAAPRSLARAPPPSLSLALLRAHGAMTSTQSRSPR